MSRARELLPFVGMFGLFLAVQLLAVALVGPFQEAGLQATEDPQDPANAAVYVLFILGFTAVLLLAMRYDLDWVLKAAILLSVAALAYYVLAVFLPFAAAVLVALGIAALLELHPEWYVIDGAGVLMGAGAAGIFGISFGLVPALLLLAVLAVYDAIAVYRTEHMLSLADGAMELNLPVLFVVPRRLDYSFPEAGPDLDEGEDEERDAFFMGLGDAVIPGVLVASAAHFVAVPAGTPLGLNLAAAGALLGASVGFAALMALVARGKPHAGLPLLNGGAILGFAVGLVAMGLSPLAVVGL